MFYPPCPHRVTNINIHHSSQFLLRGRGRRGKASYYYYLVAGSLRQISQRAASAPRTGQGIFRYKQNLPHISPDSRGELSGKRSCTLFEKRERAHGAVCAVSVFLSNIPPWPLAAQLLAGPYLAGDPNSRGVGGRRPSSGVSCECIKYTLVGKAGAHLYSATISVRNINKQNSHIQLGPRPTLQVAKVCHSP